MSARSNELFSRLIRDDLQIDLLRIDLLAVIGRNGARTALIWFGVAAVICLFFVGDNMAIWVARARSAADMLRRHVDDPSRVSFEGRGETDPIASNATADGRARNRRVEFQIPAEPQT